MTQILPAELSPALILIVVGVLTSAMPQGLRNATALGGTLIAAIHLLAYGTAEVSAPLLHGATTLFGFEIVPVRIDKLSMIFAIVFHLAVLLNIIFGWRHASRVETSMGLVYAGAAVGGVLAGDLLTLFIFWEVAAVSSVFIVWAGGGHGAFKAGMRYLVIQVLSGLLLLSGIVLHLADGGSTAFGAMALTDPATGAINPAQLLILIAFGIKAAFPLLHTWVQDSYPRASAVGTLVLSIFTTKMAVYCLARGFAGLDALIVIGCVMTVFPVFFALIENDLRKVLSYSLNNQVGFMVTGIGIGTPLALNGAVGHAFANIIFEGLLFMSIGAVLVRTGTTRATELGGLHKSMPITTVLCIIGAMAISAFPLFIGFVSKSMITLSAAEAHLALAYLVLLFTSAGVLEHSGIKIPYFAFFAHDNFAPSVTGKPRPAEAPAPMLIAMVLAAILCILIGVQPQILYNLLPYTAEYTAYTASHVVNQLQLLFFAILAFALLVKFKLYPAEIRAINLDVDWLWRVPGRIALMGVVRGVGALWTMAFAGIRGLTDAVLARVLGLHAPHGPLARVWHFGHAALATVVVLGIVLIAAYMR